MDNLPVSASPVLVSLDTPRIDPIRIKGPNALTGRKLRAAHQVAVDLLLDKDIACEAGISRQLLDRWKKDPRFILEVERVRDELRKQFTNYTIANVGVQLARLQRDWEACKEIIGARKAAAMEKREMGEALAPGEETGLVIQRISKTGQIAYEVDTDLIDTMNNLELQALKITGQLTQKQNVTITQKMLVGISIDDI